MAIVIIQTLEICFEIKHCKCLTHSKYSINGNYDDDAAAKDHLKHTLHFIPPEKMRYSAILLIPFHNEVIMKWNKMK